MAFKRHFRIYFKNNHPAYIVDEEGNEYIFHRVTHSKTSGGKKNWKVENPLVSGTGEIMYIVKHEESDKKNRFSKFTLDIKIDSDASFPFIKKAETLKETINTNKGNKKAGSHQTIQSNSQSRYESSKNIKKQKRSNVNKKHVNKKPHNKT